MKNTPYLLFFCFQFFFSCTEKENLEPSAPIVNKLTPCDSINQGLLKSTSDTIRLALCLKITGCDSLRLGILKPTTQDTVRLVSCIKITGCDSLRLGILKPTTQDTVRLVSCIKITGCDSLRLGILQETQQNIERLRCNLKIGQNFQGGKIAYILQPGDRGYDPYTKHGLIASDSNLTNNIKWWYPGYPKTTGAKETSLFSGYSNSDFIMSTIGPSNPRNYAAGLARIYNGGGYSDWYLPSKDELNILYLNRVAIGGFNTQSNCSGSVSNCGYYWSSTEITFTNSWAQDFFDGKQKGQSKLEAYAVRAVRAF